MIRRLSFCCVFILLLIKFAVLSTGCANIIPPEGGPRDTIPPVILKVSPPDSTRNFTGNRIVFTFDEFIDVISPRENVFISPSPLREPAVDYRLNTVTVKLNEQLEPNTTYVINFGDAVRDFNEGNIYKNFTYTFSTGKYIDSLTLSGKVILAESGKVDTTLIVMLHTSPSDSAVSNERPRYITRLDRNGNFMFKNLPPRIFYLYALKDLNGTRRYFAQNLTSLFAFADKPVNLTDSTKPVTLYAYAPVKTTTTTSPSGPLTGNRLGRQNTGADRLRYQTTIVNNIQELTSPLILTFEKPLKVFDSSRIRLYTDSAFNPVASYHFIKDSGNRKVELVHSWAENTSYHLVLDKEFAQDSAGNKILKTDTLSFKTKKIVDYGSLAVKFRGLDFSKQAVLLMYVGENLVRSVKLTSPDFSQSLLTPGEYELRILYDENNNGTWDPGEFFGRHKQPEIVKPIERKLNVKANWKNEFDINVQNP